MGTRKTSPHMHAHSGSRRDPDRTHSTRKDTWYCNCHAPSQYELQPEDEQTPKYWQQYSGIGKQSANRTSVMRQLKVRAKAGDIEALEELQAMVMSALMSEIDSEPEEEPRTSRSVASRRSYADYSPPPRSSARLIKLPPSPSCRRHRRSAAAQPPSESPAA